MDKTIPRLILLLALISPLAWAGPLPRQPGQVLLSPPLANTVPVARLLQTQGLTLLRAETLAGTEITRLTVHQAGRPAEAKRLWQAAGEIIRQGLAQRRLPVLLWQGQPFPVDTIVLVRFTSPPTPSQVEALTEAFGLAPEALHLPPRIKAFRLAGPLQEDPGEVASRIVASGLAQAAWPNFLRPVRPLHVPDDPLLADQWHLANEGHGVDMMGEAEELLRGADIEAQAAWDLGLGDPSVAIGVVDSGTDLTHPDLMANMGPGFDALTNLPGGGPIYGPGHTPLTEGHGTSVAGIAAGAGDNGLGISGVCPRCTILPVRLIVEGTYISDAQILNAFTFLVSQGAAVINNSWGPASLDRFVPVTPGEEEAIRHAQEEGRGGLGTAVVFAAGNENTTTSLAGHLQVPGVLAIAATSPWDTRSSYSNTGPYLLVAAPSSDILMGTTSTAITGSGELQGDYTRNFGGTSSAAPVVSGIIGLMLSANPGLTLDEIRDILIRSAERIDPEGGLWDDTGFSPKYGHGRVNARRAMALATGSSDPLCSPQGAEDCLTGRDENCDGLINEGCGEQQIGDPCMDQGGCPGEGAECITSFPEGYCSQACATEPCPPGSTCVATSAGSRCLLDCAGGGCREGYVCPSVEFGQCQPTCLRDTDCPESYGCDREQRICVMVTDGLVGSACTEMSGQCRGLEAFCFTEMMSFPGGYCSVPCDRRECPEGSLCVDTLTQGQWCYEACRLDADCRQGYICEAAGPRSGTCYKPCTADHHCLDEGQVHCDTESGRCVDNRPDAGMRWDASAPEDVPGADGPADLALSLDQGVLDDEGLAGDEPLPQGHDEGLDLAPQPLDGRDDRGADVGQDDVPSDLMAEPDGPADAAGAQDGTMAQDRPAEDITSPPDDASAQSDVSEGELGPVATREDKGGCGCGVIP